MQVPFRSQLLPPTHSKVYWEIPQPTEDFALEGWPNPLYCVDAPFLSPAVGEDANVCEMTHPTIEQRTAAVRRLAQQRQP